MGNFDHSVTLQTVNKIYLESGAEPVISWPELAIEKLAIFENNLEFIINLS